MTDANAQALSPYRWVILGIAMLAGFIGSYAQFQLPPLAYKLMPALNISASQFAALMGVSKRTLEQWEQGRREPSRAAKTLIRIADLRPEVLKEITV